MPNGAHSESSTTAGLGRDRGRVVALPPVEPRVAALVADKGWVRSDRPFPLVELGRVSPRRGTEAERAIFDDALARAIGDAQVFYRAAETGAPAALVAFFDGASRFPQGDVLVAAMRHGLIAPCFPAIWNEPEGPRVVIYQRQ